MPTAPKVHHPNYADDGKGTIDMESIIAALNEALEELRAKQKKVTEKSGQI